MNVQRVHYKDMALRWTVQEVEVWVLHHNNRMLHALLFSLQPRASVVGAYDKFTRTCVSYCVRACVCARVCRRVCSGSDAGHLLLRPRSKVRFA